MNEIPCECDPIWMGSHMNGIPYEWDSIWMWSHIYTSVVHLTGMWTHTETHTHTRKYLCECVPSLHRCQPAKKVCACARMCLTMCYTYQCHLPLQPSKRCVCALFIHTLKSRAWPPPYGTWLIHTYTHMRYSYIHTYVCTPWYRPLMCVRTRVCMFLCVNIRVSSRLQLCRHHSKTSLGPSPRT